MKQSTIIALVVAIMITLIIVLVYWGIITWCAPSVEKFAVGNHRVKWMHLDELLEKMDNGDLIFLAGNTYFENLVRITTGSYFNHVSMVIREFVPNTGQDEIFLWESDVGQNYRKGPRVIRLKDKLMRWGGVKIGAWKKLVTKDRPSSAKIIEAIPKYLNMKFDTSMTSWLFSGNPQGFLYKNFKDPSKIFCSELVASTLIDLEILPKTKSPSSYSPQSFLAMIKNFSTTIYFKF